MGHMQLQQPFHKFSTSLQALDTPQYTYVQDQTEDVQNQPEPSATHVVSCSAKVALTQHTQHLPDCTLVAQLAAAAITLAHMSALTFAS